MANIKKTLVRAHDSGFLQYGFNPYSEGLIFLFKEEETGEFRYTAYPDGRIAETIPVTKRTYFYGPGAEQAFRLLYWKVHKSQPKLASIRVEPYYPLPKGDEKEFWEKLW